MIIRLFTSEDIPEAVQLLTHSQSKFYVHSIRDEKIWRMQEKTGITSGDKFEGYAVEKDGKMVAYLRIKERLEDKELILMEASDADSHTGRAILKFLKDISKQCGFETLSAHISYHDSFAKQLVSLGAAQCVPPYAWQIEL